MSLYKRGGVWWSRIMQDGEVIRQSLGVDNKNEARKIEAKLRNDMAAGQFGIRKPPTLQEFSTQFLNYIQTQLKPHSFNVYVDAFVGHCLQYPNLANCRLDYIDGAVLSEFVSHRTSQGAKPATINMSLRVISRALQLAREWRIINHSPKVRAVRGEGHREYVIAEADEGRLTAACEDPQVGMLILVLIDTGMRISEACNLRWGRNIEGTNIRIREGKTKFAIRSIPMTNRVQTIFEAMRNGSTPEQPVFHRYTSRQPITPSWTYKRFSAARAAAGLPPACVVHSCRHTFCTRLGASGASAFEIQRLAGHSSITISARYVHSDAEQLTRAIERLNK